MSHLMDPGGTDRVVQQRIKEWQREIEGDRTAALLEGSEDGRRRMLPIVRRSMVARLTRLAAVIRRISVRRPIFLRDVVEAPTGRAEGQQAR